MSVCKIIATKNQRFPQEIYNTSRISIDFLVSSSFILRKENKNSGLRIEELRIDFLRVLKFANCHLVFTNFTTVNLFTHSNFRSVPLLQNIILLSLNKKLSKIEKSY